VTHNIIKELASAYGFSEDFVKSHSSSSYRYYAKASIPKHFGGVRTIYVPSSEMKIFQYYVLDHYLSQIPISNYATAYHKGSTVYKNAFRHRNNSYFFHIDLHHFFDLITVGQVTKAFSQTDVFGDWTAEELATLISFLTRKNAFPQGAVTSPCVSNIVFKEIDEKIAKETQRISNGVYTRYSDDITVSSNRPFPTDFLKSIQQLLNNEGFPINHRKTRTDSTTSTVKITGVCLNDGSLSLSAKYRKELRNMIYRFLKSKPTQSKDIIKGKIAYMRMIDPDYVNSLQTKYSEVGSKDKFTDLFKKTNLNVDN